MHLRGAEQWHAFEQGAEEMRCAFPRSAADIFACDGSIDVSWRHHEELPLVEGVRSVGRGSGRQRAEIDNEDQRAAGDDRIEENVRSMALQLASLVDHRPRLCQVRR